MQESCDFVPKPLHQKTFDVVTVIFFCCLVFRHQLEILLGDRLLPYNMTVYQAIKQFGQV